MAVATRRFLGPRKTIDETNNWDPYFPFGFSGVVGGAALVFFAYIGFDIVATTAEECRNPKRSMQIAILGSLGIVTLLYMLASGVLTGMAPFRDLGGDAPIADAFKDLGRDWVAAIVYVVYARGASAVSANR